MKKYFLEKTLALAFLANALFIPVSHTEAREIHKESGDRNISEVKYLGTKESNMMSFSVKYHNSAGDSFIVSVLDGNKESVYEGYFNDKNFNKIINIPASDNNITFLIRTRKEVLKQKFNIVVKESMQTTIQVVPENK